jgi:hypothetical protein
MSNKVSKAQILEELSKRSDIKRWVHNISKDEAVFEKDLFQELFIALCEMPEAKIIELYQSEQLKFYILRIIQNIFRGNGSRFRKNYREPYYNKVDHEFRNDDEEVNDDPLESFTEGCGIEDLIYDGKSKDEQHLLIEFLERSIETLQNYHKGILKEYMKLGTMRRVAEATGRNVRHIHDSIKLSKSKLKKLVSIYLSEMANN